MTRQNTSWPLNSIKMNILVDGIGDKETNSKNVDAFYQIFLPARVLRMCVDDRQ